jgi:hypothetical protein
MTSIWTSISTYAWAPFQRCWGVYKCCDRHEIRIGKDSSFSIRAEYTRIFNCPHRLKYEGLRPSERGGSTWQTYWYELVLVQGTHSWSLSKLFIYTALTWQSKMSSWTLDLTRKQFWVWQAWYRGRKVNRCIWTYCYHLLCIQQTTVRYLQFKTHTHTHRININKSMVSDLPSDHKLVTLAP